MQRIFKAAWPLEIIVIIVKIFSSKRPYMHRLSFRISDAIFITNAIFAIIAIVIIFLQLQIAKSKVIVPPPNLADTMYTIKYKVQYDCAQGGASKNQRVEHSARLDSFFAQHCNIQPKEIISLHMESTTFGPS